VSAKGSLLIALDKIQDPGNLGTIIRIADWFGLSQIVCSPDSADCYSPKAVQSTMGSIARVSVSYTDLPAWFARQKDSRVFAASLEGRDVAQVAKISEGILVIGNESKGISEAVMDYCNVRINIPRRGKAESLNAAVATGIILSHLI
jgi:TrmH family RNA methyltransferase